MMSDLFMYKYNKKYCERVPATHNQMLKIYKQYSADTSFQWLTGKLNYFCRLKERASYSILI